MPKSKIWHLSFGFDLIFVIWVLELILKYFFFAEIMFKTIVLYAIKLYQKIISPDHGLLKIFFPYGVCRFNPSCSEYAYQKINEYGIIRGCVLGFKRLLKCH